MRQPTRPCCLVTAFSIACLAPSGCGRVNYRPHVDDGGGASVDAPFDAGNRDANIIDAGLSDASGTDSGILDAAIVDAGSSVDVGPFDASASDAAVVDAGSSVDAGPFDASVPPHNFVFISSATYIPGSLGSLEAADGHCNALAAAAGHPGTYRALLSSSTVHARDRLAGARGWIRWDGKPVIDRIEDLFAGALWYPILYDEDGVAYPGRSSSDTAITGTSETGSLTTSCGDWTAGDVTMTATGGYPSGVTRQWSSCCAVACSAPAHLYCFQIDYAEPVLPPTQTGPLAFLSTPWTPNGGLAGADAHCQSVASSAGRIGTFRALLATRTASAASRFLESGPVWVRPDGVPLASSRSALFDELVDTGLAQTVDGAYRSMYVWTGATRPRDVSPLAAVGWSCEEWAYSAADRDGYVGLSGSAGDGFFGGWRDCSNTQVALYCLEE